MAKRIRIGNDVQVTWTLVDQSGEPYDLTGRSFVIELDVAWTRIRFSGSELSVEGNVVSFTYPGKEQKQPGPYHLKLVENEGYDEMITYDVKDAFVLVPHSWMEGGENAPSLSTEYVDISSVIGTKGDKGDKGEPGKDGKDGVDGKTPVITADAVGNIYVDGRLLTGIIASKTSELADSKYFQLDSSGNLTTKSGIRNLYVPGWVSSLGESPTSVGVCDGFFRTVAALRAAFPSPTVGEFAYVGTSLPAAIYVCETEGAWTDSGATFSGGAVDAVEVVDDVTSGGTTKALSAEQGVNLKALMDEGYQFRGIATTAMESYEPDQKCFYIALEPGTYFNSLVLDDGEIALLMWDTHWHKETTGAIMREELEDFLSQFAVLKGDVQEMMDNYPNITFEGDVTNAPDEEDLTMTEGNVIKFKDRPSLYGKGYVILRRNKSFAEQVAAANTIYEIRYGFDLNDEVVSIPDNSVLKFEGGNLTNVGGLDLGVNVKIEGQNTIFNIKGPVRINCGCSIDGVDFIRETVMDDGDSMMLFDDDYFSRVSSEINVRVSNCNFTYRAGSGSNTHGNVIEIVSRGTFLNSGYYGIVFDNIHITTFANIAFYIHNETTDNHNGWVTDIKFYSCLVNMAKCGWYIRSNSSFEIQQIVLVGCSVQSHTWSTYAIDADKTNRLHIQSCEFWDWTSALPPYVPLNFGSNIGEVFIDTVTSTYGYVIEGVKKKYNNKVHVEYLYNSNYNLINFLDFSAEKILLRDWYNLPNGCYSLPQDGNYNSKIGLIMNQGGTLFVTGRASAKLYVYMSNARDTINQRREIAFMALTAVPSASLYLTDMCYNLWIKIGTTNGSTRPTLGNNAGDIGKMFFDTSLSPARPIWWKGTAWVDSTGTTV